MKNLVHILMVFVAICLVSGCGRSAATLIPEPTSASLVSNTPAASSPEPSQTSIPPTDAPPPTQTVAPTDTATPTAVPPTATPFPIVEQSAIHAHCAEALGLERMTLRLKPDAVRPIAHRDFQDVAHPCYDKAGSTALVSDLVVQGIAATENGAPVGIPPDYEMDPGSESVELFIGDLGEAYTGRSTVDVNGVIELLLPTQQLGPIFHEQFVGAGIASNSYWNPEPGIEHLHLDVGIPDNLVPEQDPILIPASGQILRWIENPGKLDNILIIEPNPPLQGIDGIVQRYGHAPSDIEYVQYHLAHLWPLQESGLVKAGQEIGTPVDYVSRRGNWANYIAYVIRIGIRDHGELQVNPCELPHTHNSDWCRVCYHEAAELNPCP